MSAAESQGKRMFSSEEFLTVSQVAGFFSRLAAKKSLFSDDDLKEKLGNFPLPTEQYLSALRRKTGICPVLT